MSIQPDQRLELHRAPIDPPGAGPQSRMADVRVAVGNHLRDPMRRSSYALILGTGLTSTLGLGFWALAARWLPESTVGVGAALVSATTLLANFSTLGLRNGLVRFLPAAGVRGRRLIARGYALCAATAVLLAVTFLLGLSWWAPKLDFLNSNPLSALSFVSAVVVWVIFILQDNVLLAQRRATWVPIANGACSVLKIVLLPVLAAGAVWAIFAATVIPAVAAVALITVLVLRSSPTDANPGEPISVVRLVRFAATDHLSALLWLATADILTLVILQHLGPESSAYYFIASTIGYSLYLITSNIGSALVAEGAHHPERSTALARQAALNAARLVVPIAAIASLLAPVVLGLLGPGYVDNSTPLLRLILISAVPQVVVAVAMSSARLRHDLRLIIGIYTAQAVGILGGSLLLMDRWGLAGVGAASLTTSTAIALGLLIGGRTGLWPRGPRRLRLRDRLLRLGSCVSSTLRRNRTKVALQRRLPAALAACDLAPGPGVLLTSDSDTLVYAPGSAPDRLVKIATSSAASAGLDRHAERVERLATIDQQWVHWLPRIVRRVTVTDRVLLETRLPGRAGTKHARPAAVTAAATTAIRRLHTTTGHRMVVDAEIVEDWIAEPIRQLRQHRRVSGDQIALDRLQSHLTDALVDRTVAVATTHGDFWPGNVLVDDGELPRVTGLVDWENSRVRGLPDADLMHWWLSTQPAELGAVVDAALTDPSTAAMQLADYSLPNPQLPIEDVVLLTWLWHVSDGLRRASRNSVGRVWVRRNVTPVLHRFGKSVP